MSAEAVIDSPIGEGIPVADLDDLFSASRQVRRRFEPDAYVNLAFYDGKQWTKWDGGRLADVFVDDWQEQVVDNRIRPIIRKEVARMTKNKVKWVPVPKTSNDKDVEAAKYADAALDDAWKRHDCQRKLRRALLWSRICGAGFWKVWWDQNAGESLDVLVQPGTTKTIRNNLQQPISDPSLLPEGTQYEQRTVNKGEVCVELRSFFQLYVDPFADESGLGSAEWVGEESVYSRSWMRDHFPDFVDQVQYSDDPRESILAGRMPIPGFPGSSQTNEQGKGVKLREIWTRDYHCIWIEGGQKLLEEKNPYPWLPYVMFTGIPVPGQFWPVGLVNDLRPRQADLNKRLSQIADNADRFGNAALLWPSSMDPDEEGWLGLPGEQIIFPDTGSPNARPSFMEPPILQAYIENDVVRSVESMAEISAQHEVTGAQVPAGVTAASAISMLQEADDTTLGPDIGEMEKSIQDAGRRMLALMRMYYDEKRHLRLGTSAWQVAAFTGQDLDGVEDLEVQAGSGLPDSKAAKQGAIQQFATLFSQNNPGSLTARDWRKVLNEMEVGGLDAFFASIDRDEQQVEEENRKISMDFASFPPLTPDQQGVMRGGLPINSYDDDAAHIDWHTDFQKQSYYAQLDSKAKDFMESHVFAHREREAMKSAAQANSASFAGGPPPTPGGVGSNGGGPVTSPSPTPMQ